MTTNQELRESKEKNLGNETPNAKDQSTVQGLMKLTVLLNEEQSSVIRDMIGEDEEAYEIALGIGEGHSGYGLYVWHAEYPEEGCTLLKVLEAPSLEPTAPIVEDASGSPQKPQCRCVPGEPHPRCPIHFPAAPERNTGLQKKDLGEPGAASCNRSALGPMEFPECPWPKDVWPTTLEAAGEALREYFGKTETTAISGTLMRHGWETLKRHLTEQATGSEAGTWVSSEKLSVPPGQEEGEWIKEAARDIRFIHRASYSTTTSLQSIYEEIIRKHYNASLREKEQKIAKALYDAGFFRHVNNIPAAQTVIRRVLGEPGAARANTVLAPQMELQSAWDAAQLWLTELMCSGPDLTANAHLKLRHEAEEYATKPIVEEAADVVICLAGSAMSQRWTFNQLAIAVAVKVAVNRRRQWVRSEDGTWQHAPSDSSGVSSDAGGVSGEAEVSVPPIAGEVEKEKADGVNDSQWV